MTPTSSHGDPGAASDPRRKAVERRLVELGLGEGPRRLFHSPGEADPPFQGAFGRRLRAALEELGPVFAAFGAYLASRPDLLPVPDGLALRSIREEAEPLPGEEIRSRIEAELGRPSSEVFASFDGKPLRCLLTEQVHGARLRDGSACRVRIGTADLGELEPDLALLPLLGPALRQGGLAGPVEEVVAGFRADLEARADLAERAAALERLRAETAGLLDVRVPRIEPAFSTPRLLVLMEPRAGRSVPPEPIGRARRLCLAWLRQALSGGTFPVETEESDLRTLPDGSAVLGGVLFAALPPTTRANLRDYLFAGAADDPGEACDFVLAEMREPAEAREATENLRQRFRQAVPFREGGWGEAREGHDFAGQLFVQWRLAAEHGFHPGAPLAAFYRGLASVAMAARAISPEGDPLRDVLAELRLLDTFDRFGRLADPERLRQSFEAYAAMLADLPVSIDELLRRASEGRLRLRLETEDDREASDPGKDRTAVAISLLLALAAIVLLTHRLAAPVAFGPWAEAAGSGLFLIIGALLLRTIVRQG